jgi:threonine dehydratase
VVAASGGNHGVAVAYVAKRLGIRAKIFVPTVSSPVKVDRIRAYDADVVITGDRYADALEASERYVVESGAMSIHAFDQTETLLGQGTVALELVAQVPNAATVLVAVGGGGLIGGMAAYYAGQKPRVIGVEPVGAPTLTEALKAGRPVDAPDGSIAADSLAPRRVGELMFPIAQRHVERVVVVEDYDIVQAQEVLWDVCRLVVEPGGAAAFAALVAGQYKPSSDEPVVVVLCGGNTQR